MTAGPPLSPQQRQPGTLPDLSTDVVTRLVAGRRYPTDISLSDFRDVLKAAQARGLTAVPAGCAVDLGAQDDDFTIEGPIVIGNPVAFTSASIGPSQPFDVDGAQTILDSALSAMDAQFEQEVLGRSGPVSSVEKGFFLCNTGPSASGMLVFGMAGSRDDANFLGSEYVWGEDMEELPEEDGIVGEMISKVVEHQVEQVDLSVEADKDRRDDSVPYPREPVYFLVAHYD